MHHDEHRLDTCRPVRGRGLPRIAGRVRGSADSRHRRRHRAGLAPRPRGDGPGLALVLALGPTLTRIPLDLVQLIVGGLLLLFGLRWLRKAILRSAGVIALHDEEAAFLKETEALRRDARAPRGSLDWPAVATAFQIVMLEGVEVVFIVVAIGAAGGLLVPAAFGAGAALLMVIGLGLVLHRPLTRIPENLLKFAVGVLLSAFGTFWVGEGIGLAWPGEDWSVLALVAGYLVVAVAAVPLSRRIHHGRAGGTPARALAS